MATRIAKKPPAGALPPDGTVLTHGGQQYEVRAGRLIPIVAPTAEEVRALKRGREAFSRGDHVTLDELQHELGYKPRRSR